jgi:hypothetical protein
MTEPTWDSLFQAFVNAEGSQTETLVTEGRKRLSKNTEDDWVLLEHALGDNQKKWFVAEVFSKPPVPKRLFDDFMRAAINESNPSFNRNFVEPCIVSFGHRKVNEHLLDVVEHGSLLEIAGAVLGNEGLLKPLPERSVVDET